MRRMQHKVVFYAEFNRFEFRVFFSYNGCNTKVKEPNLLNYLSIAGGRINEFLPYPRVLALCEMQTVSSRI